MRKKQPAPEPRQQRILSCPRCSTYPVKHGKAVICPHCGFYVTIQPKEGNEVQQWNRAVRAADAQQNKAHTTHSGLSYKETLKRNAYRLPWSSLDRYDETDRYNGRGGVDACSERQSRQRLGFDDCSSRRSERTGLDEYK